ncbi:MAG: hypothetical protein AAF802_05260 [Planctomycetota bacterium]
MRFRSIVPAIAIIFVGLPFAGIVSSQDTAEATKVEVLKKYSMEIPAEFKRTEPKSRILEYEFKVGEEDKAARLTMMAAGGGIEPNIQRWKGQFAGGKPEDQNVEKMTVGQFEVHIIDVNGSFEERMGGGPFSGGKVVQRENYAMAGAILAAPSGRLYFVKMIGPQETVKSNREKFVKMVKSIGE